MKILYTGETICDKQMVIVMALAIHFTPSLKQNKTFMNTKMSMLGERWEYVVIKLFTGWEEVGKWLERYSY